MRFERALLVMILGLGLTLATRAASDVEPQVQQVTPITPTEQQRVEQLTPEGQQRVELLDAGNEQGVSEGTKSPMRRAADGTAKVVVGVTAFAVSIGATVAALLLI